MNSTPSSMRFERRCADRWPLAGIAAAYGAAGDNFGQRFVLRMIDFSDDGLGARTDRAIDPGAIVSVAFAEPGHPVRTDPRNDPRVEFIGGVRGTGELEHRVDAVPGGVAFAIYATSIDRLLAVADAGLYMPPKSTWFEPKLRSGLLVHTI